MTRPVVAHYRQAAKAGPPIIAHNNPIGTRLDQAPDLLNRIHDESFTVAVKEFSGDLRRSSALTLVKEAA